MIHVFLGKNISHNIALIKDLERFDMTYEVFPYSDIDQPILEFLMAHSKDCFEFLSNRFKRYRLREDMTYSGLCQEILLDIPHAIKFPLVIKDDKVYAGLTTADLRSQILPKRLRFLLSRQYLVKSYQYLKGEKAS